MANAHDFLMAQRAAMMGGKTTALDYIGAKEAHDGQPSPLVAMWDGIDNAGWGVHVEDAAPVNLVTGVALTPYGSPRVRGKEMVFDGSSYFFGDSIYEGVFAEVVLGDLSTAKDGFIFQNARRGKYSENLIFGYYNSKNSMLLTNPIARRGFASPSPDSVYSFSLDALTTYKDGEAVSQNVGDYWSGDNFANLVIGARNRTGSTSVPMTGSVFCVRLYIRDLTAEEAAYNYEVDKERFNLPGAA